MSSKANRLRKLETSTSELSKSWAAENRTIRLTVNSLMPRRLFEPLRSCVTQWGEDLESLTRYLFSLAPPFPDLVFNPDVNPHEAWIVDVADTPEDAPLPRPMNETAQFLFQKAGRWEHVAREYSEHSEAHKLALLQQGFFHYFASLAQTVSAQYPAHVHGIGIS